jgi:hypothetical protein
MLITGELHIAPLAGFSPAAARYLLFSVCRFSLYEQKRQTIRRKSTALPEARNVV